MKLWSFYHRGHTLIGLVLQPAVKHLGLNTGLVTTIWSIVKHVNSSLGRGYVWVDTWPWTLGLSALDLHSSAHLAPKEDPMKRIPSGVWVNLFGTLKPGKVAECELASEDEQKLWRQRMCRLQNNAIDVLIAGFLPNWRVSLSFHEFWCLLFKETPMRAAVHKPWYLCDKVGDPSYDWIFKKRWWLWLSTDACSQLCPILVTKILAARSIICC